MAVGYQLIDREELVGGIAVGVKGVMARYAMKGKALDGVDDSLAEGRCKSRIVRMLWGVSPRGQGHLDRLDQDVGTVIGQRAVDVAIGRAIDGIVLTIEAGRRST